jgi:hypothetical protein
MERLLMLDGFSLKFLFLIKKTLSETYLTLDPGRFMRMFMTGFTNEMLPCVWSIGTSLRGDWKGYHWNFNDTNVLDDITTLDVLAVNAGK